MDLAALLPVLQACLSQDQNHVKEAERVLKQVRSFTVPIVTVWRATGRVLAATPPIEWASPNHII